MASACRLVALRTHTDCRAPARLRRDSRGCRDDQRMAFAIERFVCGQLRFGSANRTRRDVRRRNARRSMPRYSRRPRRATRWLASLRRTTSPSTGMAAAYEPRSCSTRPSAAVASMIPASPRGSVAFAIVSPWRTSCSASLEAGLVHAQPSKRYQRRRATSGCLRLSSVWRRVSAS